MPNPDKISPETATEFKESEKERPNLTVYLMRHGESEKDKTNPKRGLTEKGREQVKENFERIINQIIKDEMPEFNNWDDEQAKKEALKKAMEKVEIHLTDSQTDRTLEQVWVEAEELKKLGVSPEDAFITKKAFEWKEGEAPESAGPGIAKRLKGVKGLDKQPEFRKKIGDKKYQEEVGASDELIAWALTPEDKIPEGVETRKQMEQRLSNDLSRVQNVVDRRLKDREKRIIYIANSHASIITLSASKEFNIPMEKLGEVDNAEGVRFDFYAGGSYKAEPFGENLEERVEKLKEK